jgi:CBS domain-containing protein
LRSENPLFSHERWRSAFFILGPAGESLAGLQPEWDLLSRTVAEGLGPGAIQVADVATRDIATVSPAASLREYAEALETEVVRHLSVVDRGSPSASSRHVTSSAAATREFAGLIEHVCHHKQLRRTATPTTTWAAATGGER